MSPKVFAAFSSRIAALAPAGGFGRALEIGASPSSMLNCLALGNAQKVALNLQFSERDNFPQGVQCIVGNSNSLEFDDESFDLVVSVSVLEHDRLFWRSTPEIRRVLRTGGLYMCGVPGFIKHPLDLLRTTLTYKRHGYAYDADYYRFSEQAVREVLLDGFADPECRLIRTFPNPYLMGVGRK